MDRPDNNVSNMQHGGIIMESVTIKDGVEVSKTVGTEQQSSIEVTQNAKGKITFGANMMASAVKKHPSYDYRVTEHTEKECVIDFYEIIYDLKDRTPTKDKIGTSSFTIKDAIKAKVYWESDKDSSWAKYPKAMLFARAMSAGVRYYCPDVFGHAPVYVPEEMGEAVDEDGEPINVTPHKIPISDNEAAELEDAYHKAADEQRGPLEDLNEAEDAEFTEDDEDVKEAVAGMEKIFEGDEEDDEDEVVDTELPEDLIDSSMTPREALKKIMNYAFEQEIGDQIRPVIEKHYPPWKTGEPFDYNIPELKVIKIIIELTGEMLEKTEKTKKCSSCKCKITEPEAEEQQNGEGKSLCLDCFTKFQESE